MKTICIVCPNGCHLTVAKTARGLIVKGNKCKRGERYGMEEAVSPKRIVTCVIRTTSDEWPCVSVKTKKPVLKKYIPQLLKNLYSLKVDVPVSRGDIVLDDRKTGAKVVFTRSLPQVSSQGTG